ncbi:nitrogenase iron-molybdenum cofactor biosynthesis protein NifN [Niallia nealsonii]|uniref:Nitrogenase iron-molybdenum cofactor biosynthesis protein NifN n=1 Tax=Niallia nealsonii TaxID=115979 RepID=A0A2N0YYH0_9BACI|nr:nitrogenase iron-molybdenum cofactor biosynthesis protein NifN [Niallia nealsonii]PKG22304.1 nitrogenase iron-molybdenum cofactor biosynthesis protein NifN [Niallia nealsonii]
MVTYKTDKELTINPLKVSQTLGGVLALQGFYQAIPIVHGSQGCAAFIKALMTQHYQEPIAIQTTALQEMNIIFGAEQNMIKAMDKVLEKHKPSIVAVISTGLTETAGDDLIGNLNNYIKEVDKECSCFIFPVSLPDFEGSLESGYSRTVEAMIRQLLKKEKDCISNQKIKNQINFFPGSHLTPADVMEIKRILQSFGFTVITAPDLSTSLAGNYALGYSSLTQGGITYSQSKQLVFSEYTIAVGSSMEGAAKMMEEGAGIPFRVFPSLSGLKANDEFFSFLQAISKQSVSPFYHWERNVLMDCLLDAHFNFLGKKVVLALEPDHLYSFITLCKGLGLKFDGLVTSFSTNILSKIDEEITIGDLDDLEKMATSADLWISNSHGEQGAIRMNIPFMPAGFPIFHQLGNSLATSVGYRGTTETIIKLGNLLK